MIKKKFDTFLILFCFFCLSANGFAQESIYKIGAVVQLGSPVQRIGVNLLYSKQWNDHVQYNLSWNLHFNQKNFGPKGSGFEQKLSAILFYGYGNKRYYNNPFVSLYQHQIQNAYSAGLGYHFYWDQKSTSQGTGSILLQFVDTQIILENDLFGNTSGLDQFRTGAIAVQFRDNKDLYTVKSILYTGQTKCAQMKRIKDSPYPSRFGYKDMSDCIHSDCSHGTLSFQYSRASNYKQYYQANFGIDAEQIRNFIQNKVIHDMYFIPRFLNSAENPHIPMIDENGKLYLFRKGQKIKKWSWVYSLSANGSLFY